MVVEGAESASEETGVLKNGDSMRGVLVGGEIYLQGGGTLPSHALLGAMKDPKAALARPRAIAAETDIDLGQNLIELGIPARSK